MAIRLLIPCWTLAGTFTISTTDADASYQDSRKLACDLDPTAHALLNSNGTDYLTHQYDAAPDVSASPFDSAVEAFLVASDSCFTPGQGNVYDIEGYAGGWGDIAITALYGDGTIASDQIECSPEAYGRTVSLGLTEGSFTSTIVRIALTSTGDARDENLNYFIHGALVTLRDRNVSTYDTPMELDGLIATVSPLGAPDVAARASDAKQSRSVVLYDITQSQLTDLDTIFETLAATHIVWVIPDLADNATWFPARLTEMSDTETNGGGYDVTLNFEGFAWL